jgi:predicted enzyme related to lactoylglutathione lyase
MQPLIMASKLNLNSVMLGIDKLKVMADFYEKVFEKPADMTDGDFYGWYAGGTMLSIGLHSEIKETSKEPQRIMFNFETSEVKEEFERLEKIGAKVIAKPYDIGGSLIATFADPDGNYFQLMSPWK